MTLWQLEHPIFVISVYLVFVFFSLYVFVFELCDKGATVANDATLKRKKPRPSLSIIERTETLKHGRHLLKSRSSRVKDNASQFRPHVSPSRRG